ncbi:uncharacterized protein LOC134464948 isoform X2 [Engraulis encrasicolus]|uniref:uncharacterized protein LOC134464948 isoform X2 n=1 Tax=Engraulis encrasicolus TaxID=184585 RepID=UPI002FD27FDC
MELESVSGESLSDISLSSPICGFPTQLKDHPPPVNGVVQCWTHDELQCFIETSSVNTGLPDYYRTSSCYLTCEGDQVERESVSSLVKTEDGCLGDAVSLLEVPEDDKSRRHMRTPDDKDMYGESRSINGISDVPKQPCRPLPLKRVSQCWEGALETEAAIVYYASDARESWWREENSRCTDRVEELLTQPDHCMEEMEKCTRHQLYLQQRLQHEEEEEEEEEEEVFPRTSHLGNFLRTLGMRLRKRRTLKRFLCCFPACSSRVSPA